MTTADDSRAVERSILRTQVADLQSQLSVEAYRSAELQANLTDLKALYHSNLEVMKGLIAERDRYAAALTTLADPKPHYIVQGSPGPLYSAGWAAGMDYAAEIAQRALKEGEG